MFFNFCIFNYSNINFCFPNKFKILNSTCLINIQIEFNLYYKMLFNYSNINSNLNDKLWRRRFQWLPWRRSAQ